MSDRYDLGADVPLHADAGWLMAAAIAAGRPTSLAELGRILGMSRLQASRAGKRLSAAQLLLETRDGYELNADHPMLSELARVLYLLTGTEAPRQDEPLLGGQSRDDYDLMIAGLSSRLPAHLRRSEELGGTPVVGALAARQVEALLNEFVSYLREAHALAQDAYSATKDERLRDYIHLILHVGEAARLAARTLHAGAARQAWGESPYVPVVTNTEWERVRLLLELEVADLRARAARVTKAYEIGARAGQLRQDITTRIHALRDDDELALEALPGLREHARTIHQLKEEAIVQNVIWHGGSPSMHEVGTSGDALIVAWLNQRAEHGQQLLVETQRLA